MSLLLFIALKCCPRCARRACLPDGVHLLTVFHFNFFLGLYFHCTQCMISDWAVNQFNIERVERFLPSFPVRMFTCPSVCLSLCVRVCAETLNTFELHTWISSSSNTITWSTFPETGWKWVHCTWKIVCLIYFWAWKSSSSSSWLSCLIVHNSVTTATTSSADMI